MSREYKVVDGTSFNIKTNDEVCRIINNLIESRTRVFISYSFKDNGEDQLEEYDLEGYISRSMGPTKIPILVHNRRSLGGGSILTDRICKIRTTKTKLVLYKAENYHLPKMELRECKDVEGYTHEVLVNDEVHARFKSLVSAKRYWNKFHS